MKNEFKYRRIMGVLSESPVPMSAADIAKKVGGCHLTSRDVGCLLHNLMEDGLVRRITKGHANVWEVC